MSYWIAYTLADAREGADIPRKRMAEVLGVDYRTVMRWESGDSFGRKQELDRAVAGYAYIVGLDDARVLWDAALDHWHKDGAPPRFIPVEGPAAAFAEAIRLESLRRQDRSTRPHGGEQSGKRRANR